MMVIVFYFSNETHKKARNGRYVKHDTLGMSTLVVLLYFLLGK